MTHKTGPRYQLMYEWVSRASACAVDMGLTYTELLEATFCLNLLHAKQVINEDNCPTCPKEDK